MNHESRENHRDSFNPITVPNGNENLDECTSTPQRAILDSLVFLYLFGLAVAYLTMEPRAIAIQPGSAPIATSNVANETSMTAVFERVPFAENPQMRMMAFGNVHGPPHERRQSSAPFNEFDAMVAIDGAAQQARVCLGSNDPRPIMRVSVTFATSGRAKRSEVETGPYQNTSQGDCIARRLLSASVRPFEGSAVTVRRAVQIR